MYNSTLQRPILTCILALEYRRTGGGVRLLSTVQVVCNANVGSLIRAWKTDGGRSLARASRDDIDLGALHVELGTGVRARSVQGN